MVCQSVCSIVRQPVWLIIYTLLSINSVERDKPCSVACKCINVCVWLFLKHLIYQYLQIYLLIYRIYPYLTKTFLPIIVSKETYEGCSVSYNTLDYQSMGPQDQSLTFLFFWGD